MGDPKQECMPMCMMPDGAEPCAGYQALVEHNRELQDELHEANRCVRMAARGIERLLKKIADLEAKA